MTSTGTIELQEGSLSLGPSATLTTSGLLTGVSGTTFQLNNVTLATGSTFGGAALLHFNGTTTVSGDVTATIPGLLTGQLLGAGKLTMNAAMAWEHGASQLTGGLEIAAGRTLTLSTGNQKVLAGPLINRGTIAWSAGEFYVQNTAVTNAAGSIWEVQGNQILSSSACGAPSFANAGLLRMAGSPSTLTIASCVAFSNTGTVQLRLGGTSGGQFDRVLAGVVSLAGTLDVTLTNGFVPASGNAFDVMTYSSRTGTFTTISGNGHTYTPAYGATTLTLTKQ
jgi:hypothetical protein